MTFSEAQTRLIQQLTDRYGAGEAASIVRIVLEDAFQCRLPMQNRSMTAEESDRLTTLGARLEAGEPVQYVLGEADFFGLKFHVSPAVLIPRQETEELVAQVLQYLKRSSLTNPVVLDIGLGSGCIGLTIRKKFPAVHLYGMEKSLEALAVARENADRLLGAQSTGLHLFPGDILDRNTWSELPLFDVVVSNPPYIPAAEKHLVPEHVQAHEPWMALFVGHDDPLLFYRVIADFALEKLQPGGALFFECNEFNAVEAAAMLQEKSFHAVELQKDLSGADRMIAARKSL